MGLGTVKMLLPLQVMTALLVTASALEFSFEMSNDWLPGTMRSLQKMSLLLLLYYISLYGTARILAIVQ